MEKLNCLSKRNIGYFKPGWTCIHTQGGGEPEVPRYQVLISLSWEHGVGNGPPLPHTTPFPLQEFPWENWPEWSWGYICGVLVTVPQSRIKSSNVNRNKMLMCISVFRRFLCFNPMEYRSVVALIKQKQNRRLFHVDRRLLEINYSLTLWRTGVSLGWTNSSNRGSSEMVFNPSGHKLFNYLVINYFLIRRWPLRYKLLMWLSVASGLRLHIPNSKSHLRGAECFGSHHVSQVWTKWPSKAAAAAACSCSLNYQCKLRRKD